MKWGADNKLSQARFMGRENIYRIFYSINIIKCKKKENIKYFVIE
jgi:hypothetical protein